jgi:hypothetical protein
MYFAVAGVLEKPEKVGFISFRNLKTLDSLFQ